VHIIGTAGHVDHGKSALVIALTGHNPDRWIEERERGMTLDLGFAPLRFDGRIEAGIIDVPGHERFLHNMLAGAAGMELLLLVIAATEGPKPQTFEHLRILDFLNVRRALIVLTKLDLVDPDGLRLAAEYAREACAQTVAADAPVHAVSSTTGEGIPELKAAIRSALAALPPRSPDAPAFLPIDRVFALPGHGTIVTGTLMQGTLNGGDALTLRPSGIAARARSLQVFGQKVSAAMGGSRVAINLPGVDVKSIARGETLVAGREFAPAPDLIVDFVPTAAALGSLRRRTHVRAYVGSAEIAGLLIFEHAPRQAVKTHARLALSRPVVFYPGSRFVVLGMSPKALLGGGVILSPISGLERGSTADLPRSSSDGRQETSAAAMLRALDAPGIYPKDAPTLAAALNVTIAVARRDLSELLESGEAVALSKPTEYIARRRFDEAYETVRETLRATHGSRAWRAGCAVDEIAAALRADERLAGRLLDAWHDDGRVARLGRYWRLPDFKPALTAPQRAFLTKLLLVEAQRPLIPRPFGASAQTVAASEIDAVGEAFETLQLTGAIVRIGDDLYLRSQIDQAKMTLTALLSRTGAASMAEVRDALGTSRKYALPLMEYFDGIGFTIRDGDVRRLRRPRADRDRDPAFGACHRGDGRHGG